MQQFKKRSDQYELWTDVGRLKLSKLVGTMSVDDIAKEFGCERHRIITQCRNQQLSYRFKEG